MEISAVTQAELLEAFRRRLVESLPFFTDNNTWIDDQPVPVSQPAIREVGCSLCFDDGALQPLSGSVCGVSETAAILINPMTVLSAESPPRLDVAILKDPNFSHMDLKQRILSVIMRKSTTSAERWMPTDQDGRWMLLDLPIPLRAASPRRAEQWPLLYQQIAFSLQWKWRL